MCSVFLVFLLEGLNFYGVTEGKVFILSRRNKETQDSGWEDAPKLSSARNGCIQHYQSSVRYNDFKGSFGIDIHVHIHIHSIRKLYKKFITIQL